MPRDDPWCKHIWAKFINLSRYVAEIESSFTFLVERDLDTDLTLILRAAADPTRRMVLTLLAQHGPMRATDLARHFDMSLNSGSKHIKTLESAGLVSRRTEWREHLIELQAKRMDLIDHWFKDLRSIWDMRLEKLDKLITEDRKDDN